MLTFIIFLRRLVDDSTMLQTSKIKHSYTAISTATHEDVDAIGAESYIKDLFVMGYELRLGGQGWYIPYGAGCINT